MNFRMIRYILGYILIFEALFMLVPLITSVVYLENIVWTWIVSIAVCLAAGLLLRFRKPTNASMYAKEGYIIVSLSWILLSLFGTLPFLLSGTITSFIDALFEISSGFTTTGATIFSDVEILPKSILMWRSFSHWVGGMGVLVFVMAFLPLGGGSNMHMMKAESTGPSVSKIVPRVRKTALILYTIYFIMTVIQFILLLCGEMDVFEALNTAFATAGTGGFGFRNDSMGSFSSYTQIVITVFMLLFSVNFNSYYLLVNTKFKEALTAEVKTFIAIVVASITIITFNISGMFESIGEALKHASFTVATLISTTGFSTADFNLWPELSRTIIVLLMFIGACAGSTAGGIKVSRIIILFKGMAKELHNLVHPHLVRKISIDKRSVSHEVVRAVNVYIVCYLLIFMLSLLLISFDNHDLVTNSTAVLATLNNIGPGLEKVGPVENFAFFSPLSKLVFVFNMIAGRLELFPMLLLFNKSTWKK